MKRLRIFILIVALAVIALATLYLAKNGQTDDRNGNGKVRYKEFTVSRGTFLTRVSANGVIIPIDRVEIKSKASGRIDEMPVEEGDFVKKGELICLLDQTDVQAEVDQAKANLEIAEVELSQSENSFKRQQKIFEKGLISEEAFDQAALALAQAKGKMVNARIILDQANIKLSETIVRAPIDGIILQKYVEEGQIIASGISNVGGGSPIADIANMKHVYVEAGIDEIDVGKIHIGQEAKVVAEAYPLESFAGKIIRIAPEARLDQNVTLFDVTIEVENIEGKLKSGMNTDCEITIAQQEDVILVPALALMMTGDPGPDRQRRRVLLKKGDSFIPQDIKIGLSNFQDAIVLEGLSEGDVVGVPMESRLKADNEAMENRIRSTRGFGTSGSSNSSQTRNR